MKKKEIEEEEKRNIPWKGAAQSEKNSKDVAGTRSEQSQEQMEKKKLWAMIKEIGKSEGRNERKRKFKN